MTATLLVPTDRPVQLALDLRTRMTRPCGQRKHRPYWQRVDLADVGGDLHARSRDVRALLGAEQRRQDGLWIGYHDLVLGHSGSSGSTRPQSTRGDALVGAAYQMSQHCEAVLRRSRTAPRTEVAAARQLLGWLHQLDLV